MGPPLEVRVGLAEAATLHDFRERVTGILALDARSCGMPFLSAAAALLSRGCLLLAAGDNAGDFGVYGVALVEKLTRTS
jgi:hypothetical protein